MIEESQRYLRLEHEDKESYVSYFTVNAIVGELDFPSSEIFYFQQQQFTFPVDTSMNVEIVEKDVYKRQGLNDWLLYRILLVQF